MAQQTINVGTSPNDGTGTPLRTAFQYTNSNFSELYTAVGPSGNNIVVPGTATLASATISGNMTVNGSYIACGSNSYIRTDAANLFSIQTGSLGFRVMNAGNSALFYGIDSASTSTWYDGAGGTRMTLNSTGLGVGRSPSAKLDVQGTVFVRSNNNLSFFNSDNTNEFQIYNSGATGAGNSNLIFTSATVGVRMTIDASGNLLVGKTAIGTTVGIEARPDGYIIATRSASTDVAAFTNAVYSTGAAAYRFYVGLGGTVYATNTTISAISDARFKENVHDIDVGLGAILALKPRKFDWKEGKGKNIKGDRGFIAQEFEQVFPQLVDEWADPAPEGEAPYKSVRQDLIPVLVKAIQELAAEVNALKNA